MNSAAPSFNVLSHELYPARTASRNLILAVVGSLLLTLTAKIQIPFYPVPLTLQTLAVLLIGFTYGPKLAAATVGLYLAQGAMGWPVFAGTPEKGLGLAYMAGPTGGYLAGFLLAAVACGYLAQKGWDRRLSTMLLGMLIGTGIIYLLGAGWLASLIGFDKAIKFGVTPFLAGDALKIILAAVLMPAVWKQVKRR